MASHIPRLGCPHLYPAQCKYKKKYVPCKLYQKDELREHQKSKCHADAVIAESHLEASKCSGGITAAIEKKVSLKRRAVIGALKCLYWLAKYNFCVHHNSSRLL